MAKAENVILLGPPGIGKTHLAIGLGVKATQAGYSVLFDTAGNWITRLAPRFEWQIGSAVDRRHTDHRGL